MQTDLTTINEQSQKQTLSAQMQQSLRILAMSSQELEQYLNQASMENPVLDLLPPEPEDGEYLRESGAEADQTPADGDKDEADVWHAGGQTIAVEALGVKRERFSDMLREQLIGKTPNADITRCCRVLIDCLDQRGYLACDLEDVAGLASCSMAQARSALMIVQSLQPAGVGARSLIECLLLQLAGDSKYDANTAQLIRSGLTLVAGNDTKAIMRLLGVDRAAAQRYCETVRALNPIPSRGYDTGEDICYVVPDAMAIEQADGMLVCLNRTILPRLRMSDDYSALASATDDEETKAYLSHCVHEAKTILRAVEERNNTLLKVTQCVAARQMAYLRYGGSPQAMTLREIAEQTGFHISTVSRAVKDKYLFCQKGTVSLKSLFSTGMRASAGEMVTPAMICRRIDALIRTENASNPFSDEDLKRELHSSGFALSRRTVAKYRMSMGIPASQTRMRA